jgi:hypothetical protein
MEYQLKKKVYTLVNFYEAPNFIPIETNDIIHPYVSKSLCKTNFFLVKLSLFTSHYFFFFFVCIAAQSLKMLQLHINCFEFFY